MAVGAVLTLGSAYGLSDSYMEFDSNATLAKKDLVNVEAGQLEVASAGDFLAGVVTETATNASTGVQVNTTFGLMIIMDNDNTGTTFAATHEGARFDITGTTGAQVVDTSTLDQTYGGPGGQLLCRQYNPQGYGFDSVTSIGLFQIKEQQF